MTNILSGNRISPIATLLVGVVALALFGVFANSALAAKPFSISVNGDQTAKPGNLVTFQTNITNTSGVKQNGVHVYINDATITPNGSLMFIDSPTGSNCPRVANGIQCELGSLEPGATTHVRLRYKVLPSVACGTSIVYVADVSATGAEADWAAATLNIDSCQTGTTVKLEKFGPATIRQFKGGPEQLNIGYGLRATNTGSVVAKDVRVNDTLPAGTSFISAPGCVLGTNGTNGKPEIHCGPFDLQPGQHVDKLITLKLNTDVACPSVIKNTGDITAANAAPGWSNEFVTEVHCPPKEPTPTPTPTPTPAKEVKKELDVEKSDNKDVTRPGHELTYVITVKNNGNVDIDDLRIVDTVPGKLTILSVNKNGSISGSTVTWSDVKLGAGETKDFSFKAVVKEDTANNHILRNKVVARSNDHDLTDEASDTTLVKRAPVVAAATTTPAIAVPVTARTGAGSVIALMSTLAGAAGLVTTLRKGL